MATSGDVQSGEAEGKEGETAGLGQKLRARVCSDLVAGELPGSGAAATTRATAAGATSTEAAATTGATAARATAAGATATG